jgi:hypothetical protein
MMLKLRPPMKRSSMLRIRRIARMAHREYCPALMLTASDHVTATNRTLVAIDVSPMRFLSWPTSPYVA